MIEGLQRQGYTFADLRALQTEVRYDYRPDALTRVRTWLKVDLKMSQAQLDQRLESRFAWWQAVRLVPWLSVLLVGSTIVFLIRLRKQWQPGKAVVARSVVESARIPRSSRASRPARWQTMMLISVLVLFSGILLFSGRNILMSQEWSEEWSGRDRLRGWSNLDWTVAYDGYGEVGLENRSANLRPMTSERPIESHAALH